MKTLYLNKNYFVGNYILFIKIIKKVFIIYVHLLTQFSYTLPISIITSELKSNYF